MAQEHSPHDLKGLLDQVKSAGDDPDSITMADILERLGQRSFGPLLLFAGLALSTPLSGVPGLPTVLGIVIALTAGQMLIGLDRLWLPQFVLRRSFTRQKVERFDRIVRYVARYVDRINRPRWRYLTERPASTLVAGLCFLLGAIMPPLELVPLTSAIPAFPVALFGLALMTRDGLFVFFGLAAMLIGAGAIVYVISSLV